MYKRIKILDQPLNSLQPLWRYLSHDKLVRLLLDRQLWFSHLPRLTDGLEGTLTQRTHERLVHHFLGQGHSLESAREQVDNYEQHRADFFVNCWHMNRAESYLMWRVYSDRGFAVQTTFERLQLALDASDDEVNGTVVEYRDFSREALPVGNIFTAVKTKDAPYQEEREFRLLVWRPDPLGRRNQPQPSGISVAVNLPALVERLYVSPSFSGDLTAIRGALAEAGVSCELRASSVVERVTTG